MVSVSSPSSIFSSLCLKVASVPFCDSELIEHDIQKQIVMNSFQKQKKTLVVIITSVAPSSFRVERQLGLKVAVVLTPMPVTA